MPSARSAASTRKLLRRCLTHRLHEHGWELEESEPDVEGIVAEFERTLTGGFVGTAEVGYDLLAYRGGRLRVDDVQVGVSYEPLRALSPLLGDLVGMPVIEYDVVRALDEYGFSCCDDPEAMDTEWELPVDRPEMANGAADQIAALISGRGTQCIERLADVDALVREVARVRGSDDWRGAAVLAGARRFDEAGQRIPELVTQNRTGVEARLVRQLARWIDSRGTIELAPIESESREALALRESLRDAKAFQDSVAAVKHHAAGRDREELATLLERELASRRASVSPLRLEQTLDALDASPRKRLSLMITAARDFRHTVTAMTRIIRHGVVDDTSPPAWLRPPPRAAYRVARSAPRRWTRVHIDGAVAEWLAEVYTAIAPVPGASATVDAWLDRSDDTSRLRVFIGSRQVGTVDRAATTALGPVIEAAERRDEAPLVEARLTPGRSGGHYLVELQLPLGRSSPADELHGGEPNEPGAP